MRLLNTHLYKTHFPTFSFFSTHRSTKWTHQGQNYEQNRDLFSLTPRSPLSSCFLMCSGGDQTCRHFRNSTVLGLRMGFLCVVTDESRTGESLPQNHTWVPVSVRSEVESGAGTDQPLPQEPCPCPQLYFIGITAARHTDNS